MIEPKKKPGIRNEPTPINPNGAEIDEGDTDTNIEGEFEKRTYVCSVCKYKFSVDPSKVQVIKCPWCGRILQ